MSSKRVLADQHEHMVLQPLPMDSSGKPPNKGVTIDQIPRLPYCVLVIDESSTIRGMVKACLEREGMLVCDFSDGVQALQWLEEKICKPHVVVLDVDSLQENWLPLVRYVRAQSAYADTVIVVLSRNKDTLDRLHEHLVSVQGSLTKPFLSQDLLHIIQRSMPVSRTR